MAICKIRNKKLSHQFTSKPCVHCDSFTLILKHFVNIMRGHGRVPTTSIRDKIVVNSTSYSSYLYYEHVVTHSFIDFTIDFSIEFTE